MTQSNASAETTGLASTAVIDWQAALVTHDRWLRTVIYARVGEPQAVDEVLQEVSLAAVRQKGAAPGSLQGCVLALPPGGYAVAVVPGASKVADESWSTTTPKIDSRPKRIRANWIRSAG